MKQNYDMSWYEFRQLCSNEMIILFLVYISLFFLPGFGSAFTGIIPYFALLMSGMICTLRFLRADRTGGLISAGLSLSVLSAALLSAYTHVFGFAGRLLKACYMWVVSLMFSVVTTGTFSFLDEIIQPDSQMPETGGIPMDSEGITEISVIAQVKEMSLFEKILIIFLIVLIVTVISALLFNAMKGHRFYRREKADEITEKIIPKKKKRLPLFAPNNAREAVRYYYAKYMREARKRGLITGTTMTTDDIMMKTLPMLSEEENRRFRQLYIRARYSSLALSHEEAEEAKSLWHAAHSSR